MASSNGRSYRDRSLPVPSEVIGQAAGLRVSLIADRPGTIEFKGSPAVVLSIHVGSSVEAECRRGGEVHRGTTIHGDIEVIPPGLSSTWEINGNDTALVIGLALKTVHRVVEDCGADPGRFEVRNRFQARDPQIEHIAWALKGEMEKGYPCGRIYMDGLAVALAAVVVRNHSSLAHAPSEQKAAMNTRAVKQVLAYIEDNLGRDLGLREMAAMAGLSVSHFKTQFRKSLGMSPHQYLIHRRVERAATLLRRGVIPIAQVALVSGFCHQSHLAMHMRRVLGVTPQEIRNRTPAS